MVVDDCRADLELVVHLLEAESNVATILKSENGLEAMKTIRQRLNRDEAIPEIIFLDLRMPVMDGIEFLRELAEVLPLHVDPPRVYVLTGSASDPQRLVVLEHPFVVDYIVKPLVGRDASRALNPSSYDLD
ncbi:MAG: CheY-like chemotaxis protein [Polyangiales bacterium]|jgi:CheY-like chemotaxis protein